MPDTLEYDSKEKELIEDATDDRSREIYDTETIETALEAYSKWIRTRTE